MTEESELVRYARDELTRIGQYEEDPEFAQSLVNAVAAFAEYGHSGGSASWAIPALHRLLQFKPLTPLTDDPAEWMDVGDYSDGDTVWQSRRNPACFSNDGGKTYYDLDERPPRLKRFLSRALRRRPVVWHHSLPA